MDHPPVERTLLVLAQPHLGFMGLAHWATSGGVAVELAQSCSADDAVIALSTSSLRVPDTLPEATDPFHRVLSFPDKLLHEPASGFVTWLVRELDRALVASS